MGFNTNAGKQQFTATSGQTEFDFNFAIFSGTDLKVYLTPVGQTADDDNDILAITTNYTVVIDGTLGGTVTLLVGATAGDVVTIARSLPLTRATNYVTGGDLLADTLDADQDYQTYLVVDGYTQLQRAIILPESLETINANLPTPVGGAYIKWNALGDSLENDTTIPDAVVESAQSATNAQLAKWESEASKMTSDSYATEPEDTFVKIYTSDGDGTFTATNTTEYSSLHHAIKSATWNPDNYVPVDGNKTINDVKTFLSSPIVPTPTTDYQAATKLYVDGKLGSATETVEGIVELATSAEAIAGTSDTAVLTPLKLRNGLNATGTAPIYACRAWVNFNGTGTVAIRGSGNVSSITDNGVGNYAVNFTTAMPDTSFVGNISCSAVSTTDRAWVDGRVLSTSAFNAGYYQLGSTVDNSNLYVSVFR